MTLQWRAGDAALPHRRKALGKKVTRNTASPRLLCASPPRRGIFRPGVTGRRRAGRWCSDTAPRARPRSSHLCETPQRSHAQPHRLSTVEQLDPVALLRKRWGECKTAPNPAGYLFDVLLRAMGLRGESWGISWSPIPLFLGLMRSDARRRLHWAGGRNVPRSRRAIWCIPNAPYWLR